MHRIAHAKHATDRVALSDHVVDEPGGLRQDANGNVGAADDLTNPRLHILGAGGGDTDRIRDHEGDEPLIPRPHEPYDTDRCPDR